MRTATGALIAIILSCLLTHRGLAQQLVRSADAVLVPPAEFYRVDDGVFALRPGMSVDLTNRKILLTFNADPRYLKDETSFYVLIAGGSERLKAGDRVDLKRLRATAEAIKDKAECFLDVVSYVKPQGAPPTATFRLSCI